MAKPKLSGMTWDHPRGYRCLEAASDLHAAQTGVTINRTRRSLQAFADAPIGDLAKSHDLIILDHPHVGLIAESQCQAPLPIPENGAAGSLGGGLESYVWQEQLWAYPAIADRALGAHALTAKTSHGASFSMSSATLPRNA